MCVMGDVTLMLSKLAMPMRNPKTPVIADPHMNVTNLSPSPYRSVAIPGNSPLTRTTALKRMLERRFIYQQSARAELSSSFIAFLMVIAWREVEREDTTPKNTPAGETLTPSRKTPTKNPKVTMPQAERIRNEGRAARK